MSWLIVSLIVAGGLVVGWLCAWLVHRYEEAPDSQTAVFAAARCDHCDHELEALALARGLGRCPACDARVPPSWFFTTLAVPAVGLLMFAVFGVSPILIPFLWLAPVLVVASMVDLRLLLIPKVVAWVGFGIGLALIISVAAYLDQLSTVRTALIGAACYFGFLFAVWFVVPRGMGFGDVRLAAVLGLYLGWLNVKLPIIGLFLACVLGIVLGLLYRVITRSGSRAFPFGPGLAIGALAAIWFYEPLLDIVFAAS